MTTHANRVENIFSTLLDCPAALRKDRMVFLCGKDAELLSEVESLLNAAEKAKGFLSTGLLGTLIQCKPDLDSEAMVGQKFDSWQIVRELDSGGMGIVFLAERIDGHYQQQVAIKLSKVGLASPEIVARFHTERQILANLRHPNIAQLMDGGAGPDGHPYLVMEYVQGVAIDTWCESQVLSTKDILNLFVTVCEAVQYAHRNLVVHCDLKPSNILISEGIPKLLDFGVATLIGPALASSEQSILPKASGYTPLTPGFAAPEQLRGEPVTTATDVYALGVILYQLLSGQLPYVVSGTNRADMAREVECVDITPPSSGLSGGRKFELHGDLDQIVLKALQKNPQQRYSSVQELATDLKQYLAGFSVSVSPSSWMYRGRKFVSRNKWTVGLAMLAVVSLWIGSFLTLWQWRIAQDKQDLAEQRFSDVRKMIDTLVVDLPKSIAYQPGSTPLRVQLLDQGIASLDNLVNRRTENPDLTRQLALAYAQLARLQGYPASANLGEPAKAARNYEKSLTLQHDLLSVFSDDVSFIVEIAANYSALTLINFIALRDTKVAYEYADKCEAILTPWIPSADPQVLRWLVGCYTLEAKWHSDDKNYVMATESALAAQDLLNSQASNHAFVRSYGGYLQRARMHEEWAEIEANIGSKDKALDHEQKRLDITLAHLQDDQGKVLFFRPGKNHRRRLSGLRREVSGSRTV